MNKQDKIDKIYKEIANKELNFWCRVIDNNEEYIIWVDERPYQEGWDWWEVDIDVEIIKGHPVLIGDVLRALEEKWFKVLTEEEIWKKEYEKPWIPYWISKENLNQIFRVWKLYWIWKDKRLPIEDQSEECIDYVYNLIK